MSEANTPLPRRSLGQSRRIVADTRGHDEAQVLEACDLLERYGSVTDQIRARALRSALQSRALRDQGRWSGWHHHLAIIADVVGVLALFGLLFLFLLFTPT